MYLVAIGVRTDGATVFSHNSSGKISRCAQTHAEIRLANKLDRNATVFITRINYLGIWCLAKPCHNCLTRLQRLGVKKIYYTIALNEYGVIKI